MVAIVCDAALSVSLLWNEFIDDEDLEEVVKYVKTGDSSGFGSLTCTPESGSLFLVGQTMIDCIALDSSGNEVSDSFSIDVQSPIVLSDAITDLALSVVSSTQVDLSWTVPSDGGSTILGYQIFRNVNGGWTPFIALPGPSVNSFSDTTLAPGNSVTYMVRAVNGVGPAAPSNIPTQVVVGPGGLAQPDAITNLSLNVISGNRVDLSLTIPDNNGSPILGYQIFRNVNGVWAPFIALPGPAVNSFSDTTLTSGDTVTYVVRAVNGIGPAAPSNIPTPVLTP